MNKNFTDSEISVKKLCKIAGISDTYFRRIFKEEFGTTPVRYLTELRMSYASELLESGYYSVTQVSLEVGFSDPKYFCNVFRAHYGKSPIEYKRNMNR